ncbi:MAG: hypothetical protein ACLP01_31160 [Solirubrobacteraceae bacterium]
MTVVSGRVDVALAVLSVGAPFFAALEALTVSAALAVRRRFAASAPVVVSLVLVDIL